MNDPIEHRWECTEPRVGTFTGDRGEHMARCATCGRVAVLPTQAPPPPRADPLPIPYPDIHDYRQAQRDGSKWPRHRARRR